MDKGMQALPPTIPMGLNVDVPPQVRQKKKPRHLALVLQGHRQWALTTGLPNVDVVGAAAVRLLELIDFCATSELSKVTVHLFKDDICRLPPGGNSEVIRTSMRYITAGAQNLHRHDVHLTLLGDLSGMDSLSRGLLQDVAKRTRLNTGMQLTVEVHKGRAGDAQRSAVGEGKPCTEKSDTGDARQAEIAEDPDFVIRTGGSMPVHRSMLWDTQQTALYFTDDLWPNFDAETLHEALDWFGRHNRPVGVHLNTLSFERTQRN